jgi:hypothetical protein
LLDVAGVIWRYHIGTWKEKLRWTLTATFPHHHNQVWRGARMSNEDPKRPWEQQFREAAAHLEEDLRRFTGYVNDEIVPNIRRNSSEALRAAAAELHKLAQRMDDHARRTPSPPPSPPPPKDVPKP